MTSLYTRLLLTTFADRIMCGPQLVFLALTRNGVLAKAKACAFPPPRLPPPRAGPARAAHTFSAPQAQLEESIFTILEEQDSVKSQLPLHKLDDKELTVGLLAECLHWCGLESTAKARAIPPCGAFRVRSPP